MKVILLDKIRNLGDLGDVIQVKAGYARNFLIPSGKVKMATPDNILLFEKIKSDLAKQCQDSESAATVISQQIHGKTITMDCEANEQGNLFGSIRPKHVAELISKQLNVEVLHTQIVIDNAVRTIGTHSVSVHLYSSVTAVLNLTVNPSATV